MGSVYNQDAKIAVTEEEKNMYFVLSQHSGNHAQN
jgi:hypothetical protein